ncbi:hypothetical protein [Elizabethkingia anophelis]|uniref:Uncharacterized protein n=3 Tax=Elizabethkingia anophelis TaxID=1117645 RepID=A0A455ZFP4_9FLAO|nr:hypothetical protein [Elizabethkingia anophelis]ATC35614.1 hypothetical protein BAZ09_005020 [Elizabethkingia anophelis R26]ATC39252.1 hypothetical protein EAAG1_005020 [Elizabethkingia anophelis Ag1]ATC42933.1 hypothetical protein CMV41_05020 [Elizabethkingia anophelis]ATC46609.1 hypothetical protein CMV40_05020 [Elizabethkingia anophelis]ELR81211.1 hypothetical protein D505_00440 [Elizabethkingia anophelis R26]
MMKKKKTEKKEIQKPTKRKYIPPVIEVTHVEMEEGIASGSAKITPANQEGAVDTRWNGEETIDIDTPY